MIREIKASEISAFISFGDQLNKNDPNYVPFINSDLKKSIKKLVFEKKTYKALCSFDNKGKINGRILLSIGHNKQLNSNNCGYFSHFECVNDFKVFSSLMKESEILLKKMGAECVVGPFFQKDPDNRRGILIQGYDLFPMIFTSHNLPYYKDLFEKYGYQKLIDALEYEYKEDPLITKSLKEKAQKALAENDIHIDKLDLSKIDREINDVHSCMEIASTKINFEKVLTVEQIRKIFNGWKAFINPNFAFIARKNSDNSPVGFTLSIPNYNELIKKMKGKINPFTLPIFLFGKRKVKGLRAILQYIIPDYQHKGVSKALYYETKKNVDANHIERVSLGTIMENNGASNGAILSLGGQLSRIYRIYYRRFE